MTDNINNGGPAFPGPSFTQAGHPNGHSMGMSLRQYAAIELCVPDSGLPWLDAMIRTAQRDRSAGQALPYMLQRAQGEFANISFGSPDDEPEAAAAWAYQIAGAMLAASGEV